MVVQVFALAAAVALARLVGPAEFGHAAVALIFLPLAGILTFEGFASALVQLETIDEHDRRSAMFTSLVGGALLSGAAFALTDPLWRPLFGAQTASLIELISPILLIGALGGVSRASLLRKLDFRSTSVIDAASVVGGSAVAVGLALAGLGARAIVLGALAQMTISSAMLLIAARPPLPSWSWQAQRRVGAFGLPAALAGLVEILFRNIDYWILAARLSATSTGIYYRAFNLGVVYQDKLSGVMVQVAYPVYSRTPDKRRLRAMHERAARVHAAVIFPLLALLMVLAPVLVPFLFGSAWTPSVRPTQILALAGMFAAILTGYPQVMLAMGRPRQLLLFNIGRLAVYTGAVLIASRHGLVAVAVAVVCAYAVILLGAYRFLLSRYVGISIRRLAPELGPAVSGCLGLAAAAVPLMRLLDGTLPRPLLLAAVGTVGLTVYALVVRIGFPAAWADLRLLIGQVLGPLARLGRRAIGGEEAAAPGDPPAGSLPSPEPNGRIAVAPRSPLGDAARELRGAVSSLRTNLQILRHGEGVDREERGRVLSDLVEQVERLTQLIDEVIDLARGAERRARSSDLSAAEHIARRRGAARARRAAAAAVLEDAREPPPGEDARAAVRRGARQRGSRTGDRRDDGR